VSAVTRSLQHTIPGRETSDGAGVRLRRSLGQGGTARLDPFLMLDEFATDNPDDYIGGFPPHPHRGFETVTYMLEGHMRHEDHLGNRGELRGGGVQWMTAGRGIVHSEMPQQEQGRMHGFQLWINLPAAEKMKAASYRDIPAEQIPTAHLPQGASAKVIAGTLQAVAGPIQGLSTDPRIFDLKLPANAAFSTGLPADYTAIVYVYEGGVRIGAGAEANTQALEKGNAGVLSAGDELALRAAPSGASALVLIARPLGEPVVQYGPFVMNTRAQIEQAIADFTTGEFAQGQKRP